MLVAAGPATVRAVNLPANGAGDLRAVYTGSLDPRKGGFGSERAHFV